MWGPSLIVEFRLKKPVSIRGKSKSFGRNELESGNKKLVL